MKILIYILLATFFVTTFNGCSKDDGYHPCIRGKGATTTKTFFPGNFDGIELMLDANVKVRQGNEYKVEITGYQNQIDELDLNVRSGVLQLASDRCLKNDNFSFIVTLPTLTTAIMNGPGAIQVDHVLTNPILTFQVFGSGSISAGVASDKVNAKISGSGNIILTGNAKEFNPAIAGSGDIKALSLIGAIAHAKISGSGGIECTVLNLLDISISGSGTVKYRGNPLNIVTSISGSGKVEKI